MRKLLIGAALALALVWVGVQAAAKERLAVEGRSVLFELGTVDPRSLIQGDYMNLRYRALQQLPWQSEQPAPVGEAAVRADGYGVVYAVRLLEPGASLGSDEVRVDYHRSNWQLTVGPDSFFFQEGEAATFAEARYAELRVAPSGEVLLVGLRDADRAMLGRPAIR